MPIGLVDDLALDDWETMVDGAICGGLRQKLAGDPRVTMLTPGFTVMGFADHIPDEALRERIAAGGSIAMAPEANAEASCANPSAPPAS